MVPAGCAAPFSSCSPTPTWQAMTPGQGA
uniref:Uncharacterized protein n=1 Tax=Arundo donax TaxID=35708 RepID=A0A0A9GZV7_ARUDO